VTSARKLGIRAKLFFAFAAVSGTTVIAGAAAWLMFSQVRDLFHGVAGRNIPEIVETLGLQTDTQALAGSAPTLLAAKSQGQRQQEVAALKARQEGIAKRLDEVARTQSDREAIEPLRASRIEPADAETSARWRRVVPTNWQAVAAPESLTARDFAHAWRGR